LASKRDLLVVRLAIKWKWLTPEQGEDILFLKRKFQNKLTVEQIIRRRGYLDWEKLDQLAEAASTATAGRRVRPADGSEEVTDPRPKAVRGPTRRAPLPPAPEPARAPREPMEEPTSEAFQRPTRRPRPPPAPDRAEPPDQQEKTQIAPMPELLKAMLARIESVRSEEADDPSRTIMDPADAAVPGIEAHVSDDMDDMPVEQTIFDARPAFMSDPAVDVVRRIDLPAPEPMFREAKAPKPFEDETEIHRAYEARPKVDVQNLLEQLGDSSIASLHGQDSMPGESLADLMLREADSSISEPVLTIVRDDAGDELLEGDFGPYQIRRVIARGTRSVVYLARRKDGVEVALKVLEMSPVLAARFFSERGDEILTAAKLQGPNIARILDVGRVESRYYLALQYVDGWTLEELLDTGDRLAFVRVAEIARDLAMALATAEAQGIRHGDLRPDRVLVAESGEALLFGFGFGRECPALDPKAPPVRGTLEYIAPEVLAGRPEARSDLYGLGATLYRVLTGRTPFAHAGDERQLVEMTMTEDPLDPRMIDPSIPEPLAKVVVRLLSKRPADRFDDARSLHEALEQLIFDMEAAGLEGAAPAAQPVPVRPLLLRSLVFALPALLVGIGLPMGLLALDLFERSKAARTSALFGSIALVVATVLITTVALIRRGQIPIPVSSAWLVRLQEIALLAGALALVAGFAITPPAVLHLLVQASAALVIASGLFGTLLRRSVARARADGGIGRMLAVLGDPLLERWRFVHVPLVACLTALATARFALMAYFARA
jgi:predicted Ser/Thr protein kinase